jgi:FkbM family methyltransferase
MNLFLYDENSKTAGIGQDKNILSDGEYFIIQNFIRKNDVVLDVGSYRGEWSLFVLSSVSPKMIYIFDPIADHVKFAISNFFFRTNTMMMNNGTHENSGKQKFRWFNGQDIFSELSSIYPRPELENMLKLFTHEVEVDCLKLDEFLNINDVEKINFIKIDNEGSELPTLKGLKNYIQNKDVDFIQFHYCSAWKDAGFKFKEVFEFLTGYEYRLFRILQQDLLIIDTYREELEDNIDCNYLAISDIKFKELVNG